MNPCPAAPLESFVDKLLVSAELVGYAISERMNEKPVMQTLFRGVSAERQTKADSLLGSWQPILRARLPEAVEAVWREVIHEP